MTKEIEAKPSASFTASRLPWVLAAVMLVVYLATLQPWLTVDNRTAVSYLAGWNWRPNIFSPISVLVTAPLGWLPPRLIPLGLNILCAVCGALTLGLLARSVALLPHDRTNEERERLAGLSGLLTIRFAWLPCVFAVLVCGLSFAFWRSATFGGGQLIDALIFAYLVRCLLEFRIDGRESWLTRLAFGYGLAMADDWLFALLFPAVLIAVIWIKGTSILNWRFLLKMLALGLLGLSIVLLLPLIKSFNAGNPIPFKTAVVYLCGMYKANLTILPKGVLAALSLTSVLPVAVMAVRWAPFSGDTSKLGAFAAQCMVNVVHAFLLLLCLWSALDPRFSPRELVPGLRSLPLYYLGALGIGYYAGFFLLVFGNPPLKRRHRPPALLTLLHRGVIVGVWLIFLVAPVLLAAKSLPLLARRGHDAWQRYGESLERSLPPAGSVLLSDDPSRLFFLQAWLDRAGKSGDYLLLDTSLLRAYPDYFKFVDRHNPSFKLESYLTNTPVAQLNNPLVQLNLLKNISRTREIDYLHPSFGYFFEAFYQHPRGLFYRLALYPPAQLQSAPLTATELAENQRFWQATESSEVAPLVHRLYPPKKKTAELNLLDRTLKLLHASVDSDYEGMEVGRFYSRSLDYWGVTLQSQEQLPAAAVAFQLALDVNPENDAAKINLAFNGRLQAGAHAETKTVAQIREDFGTKRDWDEILGTDGPFDEPNFCYHLGMVYIHYGNFNDQYRWLVRQSIQQLERTRRLAPDQVNPRLWLAQLYDIYQQPTNELAVADEAIKLAPHEANALYLQANALIQLHAYDRAIPALNELLSLQTNNLNARLNRAIAYLGAGQLPAAQKDYEIVAGDEKYENRFRALYGLGEIAYRNKDHPSAIRNYQLYLKSAPTNTEEFKIISGRLGELTAPGK